MKVCGKCGQEIFGGDGDNRCPPCERGKKQKAALSRKEREDVMRSLGLVKAKGARGGTYWE
jgi:uncharacterized Zn finger protein (UPF0148 family)